MIDGCPESNEVCGVIFPTFLGGVGGGGSRLATYQLLQNLRITYLLETNLPCLEEDHLVFISWLRMCRESMFHCPVVLEPSAPSMGTAPLGELGLV